MEINAIKPSASSSVFSNARRNDAAIDLAPKAQNADTDPVVKQQQVKDVQASEKNRLETVMRGSRSYANLFAAGDKKFTIFKDSSGQFVTRFTNLRDGSVVYIPEPDIVQFMENTQEQRAALIEVQA